MASRNKASVAEAITQFNQLVISSGGRTTDQPYPVADTLLIGRVLGNRKTLESLLEYDRVARAYLPPILEGIEFASWSQVTAPEAGHNF